MVHGGNFLFKVLLLKKGQAPGEDPGFSERGFVLLIFVNFT